ncbi:hypothetical protein ASD64_07095 [Mesorhizobium sp. Root157]|uniref:phage virion morphogenesis protein n=1 Tax=Mesorhizobium sp. Root157 TaxID=1736477 RepID=UPI0006F9223E|nr:phage virion morphogenesis protein [Mesorhizobium sp. Root157]KQZ87201.1 hypothetical protein ASD64_07095 [Mesorhizobium sp. Root157]
MSFRIVVEGVEVAAAKVAAIGDYNRPQFLDELGGLVVSQTQRRIRSEKTAPDGSAWKPNIAGTSILFASGALDDSIHHVVGGSSVQVGSGLVYAGIHQHGGTIEPKNADKLAFFVGGNFVMTDEVEMPARPYVGISAENGEEIELFAEDFIVRSFQ